MKNKKFLKALASFVLGGAAAVGCFAMFGCAHSHTYSEDWKNDAEKHWHEATCEHTGEKSGEAVHEFDADGKCVVCDYQKPQEHKHTWATAWSSNESEHWKECTDPACNEVSEKGPHTVQDGKCIVCGKETGNGEQPVTKYSVTFNVHGHGTAPENLTEVTALPELSTLTEEGWIFGGWYYDDGFLNQANAGDALTANVTLHAKWTKDEQGGEDNPTQYTVTFDVQGHGTAPAAQTVTAGGHATVPTVPTEEGWTFVGWYKEAACTNVFNFETETITAATTVYAKWTEDEQGGEVDPPATQYTVTFDMHGIGTAPATQTVDKDGYATMPAAPSATGYYFVGWYTDDTYATGFDFENTAITADTTVYACWSEDIKSTVTIPTVTTNTVLAENTTIGQVTFIANGKSRWESGSLYNSQGSSGYIEFVLSGSTNSVSFSARCASGEINITFVSVNGTQETVHTAFDKLTGSNYLPNNQSSLDTVIINNLPAGTYRLKGDASYRVTNISVTERLVVSEADSIRVTPATVDFVIGSEFTSEGLATVLHYKNGREDVITGVTVDSSAYKKDVSGKYPVTVSYTVEGSTTPFTSTYYVYVYQVDSISLKTNATQQGANTPAGNGTYINHAAQQVYFIGNELNLDGYTVHLNASVTAEGEEKKEKLFRYTPVASDFEGFDTATAGAKTVTLNAYGHTDEFEVLVMAEPVVAGNMIGILVSQKIGNPEKVGEVKEALNFDGDIHSGDNIQGMYIFETIQQALDFLELLKLDENVEKRILLDAGIYREKLEINIPNLTIMGGDTAHNEDDYNPATSKEDIVIEWDSLYGVADESGYVQTTDSTATLNVRASATGFKIENVTISNYWNSEDRFDQDLYPGYSEHRALAMLIQADKVVIDNCVLLGYQDTIELFTGRQWIKNTYISGTTDFIFGTNNTTYFENCEIHSIERRKADGSAYTDGGYITAFKGNNKNDSDYVVYGAIFDKCTFTADKGVAAGNTAIARPWGAYAAVAVINSELGGHIATKSTGTASKNERYVTMGSNKPTDSTVKFVEYNNTGDGAITEAVAGMRFLTAEEAVKYSDLSVIFGKTNGGVKYDDVWGGSLDLVTVDIVLGKNIAKVYAYKGGTLSQAAINAAVESLLDEGYVINTLTYGDNKEFTADTVITDANLQVIATQKPADMTVTQSVKYLFDGTANSETRTLEAGATAIWGKLELNATGVTGTANGFAPNNDWYIVNNGLTISLKLKKGSSVKIECYSGSGFSYKVDGGEATAIDFGEPVNNRYYNTFTAEEDCVLTYVVTAQNYIKSIDINVPVIYNETTDIDLLDFELTYQAPNSPTGVFKGIEIDASASGAKFGNNNGSWLQFNTGTILKLNVAEGAKVTVTEYNNAGLVDIKVEGTVATITATGNTYINAIHVKYAKETYTYTYGETNDAVWSDVSTKTASSSDTPAVVGRRLDAGTYLTLNAEGKKATVTVSGFTTATGNATEYLKVEFLKADGTVLATLVGKCTAGKVNGEFTFTNNVVTTDEAFTSIRLTCSVASKHVEITSASILVEG